MSEDNVVKFPGVTDIYDNLGEDVPVENMVAAALERNLQDVIILGTKPDGEFYFATSSADYTKILWDLEHAKMIFMTTVLSEI